MLKAHYLDAVAALEHTGDEDTHEGMRKFSHRIASADNGYPGENIEQPHAINTDGSKHHGERQGGHHHHVLYPVIAGEHRAQLLLLCLELDQSVKGDNEDTAHETHGNEREPHTERAVQ